MLDGRTDCPIALTTPIALRQHFGLVTCENVDDRFAYRVNTGQAVVRLLYVVQLL